MKHWKHTVAILLTLCLIGGSTALAQDEWQLCSPEEVDVSGVQEINGRLVGEIALPESAGHIRLMVPRSRAFYGAAAGRTDGTLSEGDKGRSIRGHQGGRTEREGRKAGAVLP